MILFAFLIILYYEHTLRTFSLINVRKYLLCKKNKQNIGLWNPPVTFKYQLCEGGQTKINSNLKINAHICASLPQHVTLIEIQLLSSSPPRHACNWCHLLFYFIFYFSSLALPHLTHTVTFSVLSFISSRQHQAKKQLLYSQCYLLVSLIHFDKVTTFSLILQWP